MDTSLTVPAEVAGDRLDAWLNTQMADLSRSRLQGLIKAGRVRVNDTTVKPNYSVREGDTIVINIPEPVAIELEAEDIPLAILYEDTDVIVINKAPDMVIHPAPGTRSGTLVNALLHHCEDLRGIGGELRPGIVHRLDKDTSGVIIVAKNEPALNHLANQFRDRTTQKQYLAIVHGQPRPESGTIEAPIGRHPVHRKKMSVREDDGRYALSHYQTVEKFPQHSLLQVEIKTGRTHQIRVHLAHLGHPILGDAVYGKKGGDLASRQMLHAYQLEIAHPHTNERMNFVADPPPDMQKVLRQLRP